MQPKKILVVDDSKLYHQMLGLQLRQYQLVHAYDGKEALNSLKQFADIDLILLDLNMPVMGGLEFLKRMMSDASCNGIPVVIMGTVDENEDVTRALQAGATASLTKPFKDQELSEVIQRI